MPVIRCLLPVICLSSVRAHRFGRAGSRRELVFAPAAQQLASHADVGVHGDPYVPRHRQARSGRRSCRRRGTQDRHGRRGSGDEVPAGARAPLSTGSATAIAVGHRPSGGRHLAPPGLKLRPGYASVASPSLDRRSRCCLLYSLRLVMAVFAVKQQMTRAPAARSPPGRLPGKDAGSAPVAGEQAMPLARGRSGPGTSCGPWCGPDSLVTEPAPHHEQRR